MMKRLAQEGFHLTLRSGITIYPTQGKKINDTLTSLLKQAPAQFILLLDITGQVISSLGEQEDIDLIVLGSLVAGDLAASQEIARVTNQYQANQLVLRQGQNIHTVIVEAGNHLALFVQISDEVPLGWGRMLIQRTARQLAEIVATGAPEAKISQEGTASAFNISLADELTNLLDDALDDLWRE